MQRKLIISLCAAGVAFGFSLLATVARLVTDFLGYVYLIINWSLLIWVRIFPNPPHGLKVWPTNKAMLASFLTNSLLVSGLLFLWLSRRKRTGLR